MKRARIAGKEIGRPEKIINKDNLISLLSKNISRAKIAKELGISKATLYKEFRRLDIEYEIKNNEMEIKSPSINSVI